MTRAQESLEKLLKVARADVEALRIDLADVARAKSSAEGSLDGLDETVRREEAMMKEGDAAAFAAYMEGVRARRHNLQTTLLTLGEAEDSARDKLEAAFLEIKKLEHLIGVSERSAKKNIIRDDIRTADENFAARIRVS